jgi:hypothetical protein
MENKANPLLGLMHDVNNVIDRIRDHNDLMVEWLKENGKLITKENGFTKNSNPYVIVEYMKSHVKELRSIMDAYYNEQKQYNENNK